jgi:hypothetical protein
MASREPNYFELPGGGYLVLGPLGFKHAQREWSIEPRLYEWDMHNAPKTWPSVVEFKVGYDAQGPNGAFVSSQTIPDAIEEAEKRLAILRAH